MKYDQVFIGKNHCETQCFTLLRSKYFMGKIVLNGLEFMLYSGKVVVYDRYC